jgi:hypothetical protein|tara:strand:- start:10572 stop:11351 length:780 start_codon:yes stop_codon:yes gene_type:complete
MKQHISYSELKMWADCPRKHKLVYIDKLKGFTGNEYTAFGSSIHALCENAIQDQIEESDYDEFFNLHFEKELERLGEDHERREDLITEMRVQAKTLSPQIIPAMKEVFGDFTVVSVEEKLYEKIMNFSLDKLVFKGYIDLVIKTTDGKYHVIDWKTCSWGWDREKKNSKLITYQLTLYKKFFCQKHNIDPSLVETHFALLKRTAKKDNVEVFRVTSGPKKTANATDLLHKALLNIDRKMYIKNRLSCKGCDFYKSAACP